MNRIITKIGHQAPKGWRVNRFNSIEIEGDFAYCKSHNFIYDTEVQERLLYYGIPCHYTDIRYIDTTHNYFKNTYIFFNRRDAISLKSCIRRTLDVRNIPIGTVVNFKKDWYFVGRRIDNGYLFRVKKENRFDPKYEVNDPQFFNNFQTCKFSKDLTNALRENGFLVKVKSENPNFISSMFSTAVLYASGKYEEPQHEVGEMAIAYGYGKKIGFSSNDSTFMGYSNGREYILWDRFGEFDKWSRCEGISKTTPINEIVNFLKMEI